MQAVFKAGLRTLHDAGTELTRFISGDLMDPDQDYDLRQNAQVRLSSRKVALLIVALLAVDVIIYPDKHTF